jgi:hypothetical protein
LALQTGAAVYVAPTTGMLPPEGLAPTTGVVPPEEVLAAPGVPENQGPRARAPKKEEKDMVPEGVAPTTGMVLQGGVAPKKGVVPRVAQSPEGVASPMVEENPAVAGVAAGWIELSGFDDIVADGNAEGGTAVVSEGVVSPMVVPEGVASATVAKEGVAPPTGVAPGVQDGMVLVIPKAATGVLSSPIAIQRSR